MLKEYNIKKGYFGYNRWKRFKISSNMMQKKEWLQNTHFCYAYYNCFEHSKNVCYVQKMHYIPLFKCE